MALINDRQILSFSGDLAVGAPATAKVWLENSARFGFLGTPPGYPKPPGVARILYAHAPSNTMVTPTDVRVLRQSVATGLVLAVPAGSTAVHKVALPYLGGAPEYADGEKLDVEIENTDGNGTIYIVATVVYSTFDNWPDF